MVTGRDKLIAFIGNFSEIYPDAKGVPGATVIRIAATRHCEVVAKLERK